MRERGQEWRERRDRREEKDERALSLSPVSVSLPSLYLFSGEERRGGKETEERVRGDRGESERREE